MENGTQMTLEQWMPEACPKQTAGASDSLVKTSALPIDSEKGFREIAQACFSELCTCLDNCQKKVDPLGYSLRMLKICLVLMEDGILPGFSLNWTGGGMMQSGKFSTLKITECHKTENAVSLLGILENPAREEFYLSQAQQTEFLKQYNAIHPGKGTNPNKTGSICQKEL